jgi:3-hydroxyisobutyrate dehydrogenase-like beta-hydroxyacid dehydrogenase
MAAAAKLYIVSAGDPTAIAACTPLLETIGQRIFVIGSDPGAANLVKLSGNFLIASAIEALGEAIALVGKAGIDKQAFASLLAASIFPVPAYAVYGELIARGNFKPAGFAAPLGFKDIRLTLAAAADLQVPMPLGSLLHDRFQRLLNQGGEDRDWSAIGGLAAYDAGGSQPAPARAAGSVLPLQSSPLELTNKIEP